MDLDNHSNHQPVSSPSIGSIHEPQLEFEPLDLNLLAANIPRMPQRIQPIDMDLGGADEKKIFNNMPGFLISAIQKLKRKLKFENLVTAKTGLWHLIRECAIKLTNKVLLELSSKNGNREQLRMVFNDVDEDLNGELVKKAKESDFVITIKRYFELLRVYGEEVMNEAKKELRIAVGTEMTRSWMHSEAQNRAFTGQNVELKKRVFFQYMSSFRGEVMDGEVSALINRKEVMSIELFQN